MMPVSEYEGCLTIECDRCGSDANTGVATALSQWFRSNDELVRFWVGTHGWEWQITDDGRCEYLCPSCAKEVDNE